MNVRPPWLPAAEYELEVLPGLECVAAEEALTLVGTRASTTERPGRLSLAYDGDATALLGLRTVVAIHVLARFAVRRPGDLSIAALTGLARRAIGDFAALRLSAAGADSPEMTRLGAAVARELRLERVSRGGDLLLALRRYEAGWEALVRLTPRPLSARSWRVCNLPGALDATAASAMARVTGARPDERYLNLACGSGTLLVERLALGPAAAAVGIDHDEGALACAAANLRAASATSATQLLLGDVRELPLLEASFDTAAVDLPFGMLVGRPEANAALYAATLAEAARAVRPGGALIAITAAGRTLERQLSNAPWHLERTLRIEIPFSRGYIKPTIHLLRRTGT